MTYLQSIYYEHLGVPAWLAHIAAGAALWAAIKAWSTGFRKFQAQVEQLGSIEAVLSSAKEARVSASTSLCKGSQQVGVEGAAAGVVQSASGVRVILPVRRILSAAILFTAGVMVGAKKQHCRERRLREVALSPFVATRTGASA